MELEIATPGNPVIASDEKTHASDCGFYKFSKEIVIPGEGGSQKSYYPFWGAQGT
jgi:hypothetical protein